MKELVEFMAKGLVGEADQVHVKEVQGDGTHVLELSVAQGDLGKVIGKRGRTVRAMRTILQAAGTKAKVRTILEVID